MKRQDGLLTGDGLTGQPTYRYPITTDGGDPLSLDAILELLANAHRRAILTRLREDSSHVASLEELVSHLVRLDADRTGTQPGRDHVEATLLHVHLPKLANTGVIEYDAQSEQLRYWPNERVERWLSLVEDQQSE